MFQSIAGPPNTTAKAANATSVVNRWDLGVSLVTIDRLRLIGNQSNGINEMKRDWKLEELKT